MALTKSQTNDIQDSPWSFQAGNLALDFANTVNWHASDNPGELLINYGDLANWAKDYSLLTPGEFKHLTEEAHRQPDAARKVLKNAIDLRETIFRIFSAIANDTMPEVKDLKKLKEIWEQAVNEAEIVHQEKEFSWSWEKQPPALEKMFWLVSGAAIDLLLRKKSLSQVGQCADDRGCGLLFIDTSRNHSRQWCSMESCGNRAKAQRHYHRYKAAKP
jgi:predicted RNA-binding Zn ribbon-like protein